MAPRILDAGHELTVWNRTADKAKALVDRGAKLAGTPAEVAASCDIVVSILSNDDVVLDVYEGRDGLLSNSVDGKLFVDMSTLQPGTVRELAQRVYAAGAGFIDAPVSGTVGPAKDGTLLILCGGTDNDIEIARPILDILGRRLVHAGPAGQGALMKLVVNLPLAVYWGSLAEALAMGSSGGLDLKQMLDTIQDSSAALAVLPLKTPNILGESAPVAFDISNMQKDLRSMLETGADLGVSMPTTDGVLSNYSAAAESGLGEHDAVDVVQFMIEQSTKNKEP
jgi:3-hydroxyisobutyrate dehydrogenase-like beta-hydroxyacid dehydrogenase